MKAVLSCATSCGARPGLQVLAVWSCDPVAAVGWDRTPAHVELEKKKLEQIVSSFDTAMLSTVAQDGSIRARPMHVARFEPPQTLWFLSSRAAGHVDEIVADQRVGVTMQAKSGFVSLSGTAFVVRDPRFLRELWSSDANLGFATGPDDPNLVGIRFTATVAESWDTSAWSMVKYALQSAKAAVTGERRPDEASAHHDTVELDR